MLRAIKPLFKLLKQWLSHILCVSHSLETERLSQQNTAIKPAALGIYDIDI